jgi:hypothetical protein
VGQREPAASPDGDPDVASSDETTLAEGDWPVAPQYQVTPDQPLEDQRQGERATVAVGPPRGTWLRHPPRAAVLATVLALVLLLGAAAAWIAVGLDEPTGTGSAAPPSPSAGASEPSTPPPSSGTTAPTASTETDTDTGTTTAEPTARVSVPGVVGLPASVAARRVRAADLRPETRVVTSSSPTGTVVGQDPSPGTELERGDAVVLRVARQPRPTTVQMPRLEGLAASARSSRTRAST